MKLKSTRLQTSSRVARLDFSKCQQRFTLIPPLEVPGGDRGHEGFTSSFNL